MTTPNLPTDHRDHDLEAIAAYAAGDLDGAAEADARVLVDACAACAGLAADLRTIQAAARALPTPERPRSFTLTEADARRLRPGRLRRLAGALTGPRSRVLRPVASGMLAIGIVGVVASVAFTPVTTPAARVGSDATGPEIGAPAPSAAPNDAVTSREGGGGSAGLSAESAAPAPPGATAGPELAPIFGDVAGASEEPVAESTDTAGIVGPTDGVPGANDGDQFFAQAAGPDAEASVTGRDRTVPVIFGSIAIIGLGVLLLTWLARRYAQG